MHSFTEPLLFCSIFSNISKIILPHSISLPLFSPQTCLVSRRHAKSRDSEAHHRSTVSTKLSKPTGRLRQLSTTLTRCSSRSPSVSCHDCRFLTSCRCAYFFFLSSLRYFSLLLSFSPSFYLLSFLLSFLLSSLSLLSLSLSFSPSFPLSLFLLLFLFLLLPSL